MPAQASNQFFPTLPTLPGTGANKTQPGGSGNSVLGAGKTFNVSPQNSPYNPYTLDVGGGYRSGSTLNPNETSSFIGYLMSMMGKGASPYNLSVNVPGGGRTAPGALTAGMDPIVRMMDQFFKGQGGGLPGMSQLSNIAQGATPEQQQLQRFATQGISATPTWQTMVDAMQRQIGQGRADLSESMNVGGGLVGSPYGTAMADYNLQSDKDLNSLLSQMQFQGIQEQIGASEALTGQKTGAASTLAGMGTDFGKFMQGLDQESVQNMYQEFIRTRPEYSPLLAQQGQIATSFPAYMGNKTSTNPLAGLIPGAAQGLGAGIGAAAGGAGAGASSIAGLLAMLSAI